MDYRQCHPAVVEDDDDFAWLLQRALRKEGVPEPNIRWYRDGESALSALRSPCQRTPSLLFLDIDLPGISGLSVLERIRSSEPLAGLPAFVLSGTEDPQRVAAAYRLRARGFWVKPPGSRDLQEIISGILKAHARPEELQLPRCLPDPGRQLGRDGA